MLSFRLFGIPIGVHATFLFVALLGATAYRGWDIAWWTVAAFVSILIHELGHALTAKAFGGQGISVTLYGLGGLTTYSHRKGAAMSHFRSFLVSAAGSFVGIVFGGAMWLLADAGVFDGVSRSIAVLIDSFIFTALVWGVLNWIPVVPLDGGHMVQSLISVFDEERAPLISQIITWIAVAIIAPIAWINGYEFAVLILGFFAFAGYREYRSTMERRELIRKIQSGEITRDEIEAASTPDESADENPPASPSDFPI